VKKSNELAHIRQLCALGLPAPAVTPALLRAVRATVSCESAGFFWIDADGDMANMYAERMLPPEVTRRYFERHYEGEPHAFRQRLAERLARGQYVAEVSADGALERTEYYMEILRPLDAHRILHAIVHENGRAFGQLSLYRAKRAPRFSSADHEVAETAARYVVPLLSGRARVLKHRLLDAWRDSDLEALVVCSADGEIRHASYRAYALLAHASGEPINRSTMAGAVERAGRNLLRRTIAQIDTRGAAQEVPVQQLTENDWGRYRLRAYALGDKTEDRFGVLIQRQEHLLVRIADAMRQHPLSAQQREAALLLAQGKTNSEIAAAMGVSINTASYHVKQLFAKLDAHDRAEAIARILDGHTARGR
jgi:DNA-binding CsgD family transcriptional regulator